MGQDRRRRLVKLRGHDRPRTPLQTALKPPSSPSPASGIRTFRTILVTGFVAGVDVKVVSERLGHSSPMVTWQTYQHVVEGMQSDLEPRTALHPIPHEPRRPVTCGFADELLLGGEDSNSYRIPPYPYRPITNCLLRAGFRQPAVPLRRSPYRSIPARL
jgi:hypothetical protein